MMVVIMVMMAWMAIEAPKISPGQSSDALDCDGQ